MKRPKIILASIAGALLVMFGYVGISSAHSFRTGDNVTITGSEKVDDTIFVSGRNIDISSDVNGDVFCAGQTINVSGNIHGDVICAGQTVRVSGTVDGDVRLAGQTVSIGGKVNGNATVAGQTFTLDSDGNISGDLTVGSQDATLNGDIGRDLAVGSNDVIIAGKIGRDVKGSVTSLSLASSANVTGNIDYTSATDLHTASGAKVGGDVTRTQPAAKPKTNNGAFFGLGLGWFFYCLVSMLLVAMVFALLFPRLLLRLTDRAMPRPWKALLIGFIAAIAVPVIFIILFISIIGIPLALMFMLAWALLTLVAGPVTAFYLGRLMLRDDANLLLYMLSGSVLLIILYFIPIIGIIAIVFAVWTGVGMFLMEIFDRTPRPHYSRLETKKART